MHVAAVKQGLLRGFVLPIVLVGATPTPAQTPEKDIPRYALCPANIQEARVLQDRQSPGTYHLFVHLTKEAATEFARLTAEHVGQMAQIEFDGLILERAVIRVKVSEGRMQLGSWQSLAAASRMVTLLLDKQLTVPCGRR